jgi:hypothetical protein
MLVACSRYEYRPIECRAYPTERGPLTWSVTSGAPAVEGVVRLLGGPITPVTASARLEPLDSARGGAIDRTGARRVAPVDSAGHFRFDAVESGCYVLRVTRVGFVSAEDTVAVGARAGVAAQAALQPSTAEFDECHETLVRTRKPWYRWPFGG